MAAKKAAAGLIAVFAAVCMILEPVIVRADSTKADLNKPYIALGADLNANERAEVLRLLEVTEDELKNYTVATITNDMEHEYLDSYLSSQVIGSRALSSVKVIGKENGNGIKVTTKNISYCTTGMYQNALATAGVEDVDVTVAGPMSISGTAALVGTMEAYENMTGDAIEQENVEAATNELVVTSELGEAIGDQEKAEELVGAVKDIVVGEEVNDSEQIEETVTETAEQLNISLSEEDKQQIVDLMEKISDLDLDVDSLKQQVQGLYDRLASLDINISEADVDGFFASIGSWASDLWNNIKGYFSGLFQ
ncbi:MAG: DUF1002 domain-containing protein [Ruminococcus sp.]|jgi:uncharacterized protein YpuA (DUF1002 family)